MGNMGKKKRGRLRGRGTQGPGPRGNGYRGQNRPVRPSNNSEADLARNQELPPDNGEPIVFYREDLETLIDFVSGHHEMPQKARDFV